MDGSFIASPAAVENADARLALIGDLERAGVISDADAGHIQTILKESREAPDQVICKLGLATEDAIADAYAQIFALPRFHDDDFKKALGHATRFTLPQAVTTALNKRFLFSRRIFLYPSTATP